jgi:hypothetical protein
VIRSLLVVLAAGALVGAAAAGPRFETAPHRQPPLLIDHHGEAKKPVRIVTFIPKTYPDATTLQYFGNAIAASHWMQAFARAYGFPAGTLAQGYQVTDMPKLTSHSKASTYQNWIGAKMLLLGIPPMPSRQTIFILYIPCKPPQALDSFGCTSHHPGITPGAPQFGSLDSMAVVTSPSTATIEDRTRAASHELAEGVTDRGGGWSLAATDKDRPWLGSSAFVEDEGSGNIEAADMTQGSAYREEYVSPTPPSGFTYTYVRVYANGRSKQGGDPGVPASPEPYYNVSAAKDWFGVPAGGAATPVTLTGWSAKKIPPWKVTARVVSWTGVKTGSADPCSISGPTSWSVKNAGAFTLRVKARAHTKGEWCDVLLKSAAAPTADGDLSHPWFVGFHVD